MKLQVMMQKADYARGSRETLRRVARGLRRDAKALRLSDVPYGRTRAEEREAVAAELSRMARRA